MGLALTLATGVAVLFTVAAVVAPYFLIGLYSKDSAVEEPASLCFFFGRLAPTSDWQEKLAKRFRPTSKTLCKPFLRCKEQSASQYRGADFFCSNHAVLPWHPGLYPLFDRLSCLF